MGTVRYMAPEVLAGRHYTKSCDTFSFGLLLWEMIHVERVFAELSSEQAARRFTQPETDVASRPRLGEIRDATGALSMEQCPDAVNALLRRAWCADWSKRPTMDEVMALLEVALQLLQPYRSASRSSSECHDSAGSRDAMMHSRSTDDYTAKAKGGTSWVPQQLYSVESGDSAKQGGDFVPVTFVFRSLDRNDSAKKGGDFVPATST